MAKELAEFRTRSAAGIVDALNREWRELGQVHQETASRWSAQHRALVGCGSFDEILQAAWLDPDAVLAALLAEVANDDQLAARVVLQSMIGRMVQMALRDRWADIDDYISALWCQIRTYPLSNRPQRIAANLSLDTLKAVSSERRWLKQGKVSLWPPESFLGEAFEVLLMGHVADERAIAGGSRATTWPTTRPDRRADSQPPERRVHRRLVRRCRGSAAPHQCGHRAGALRPRCRASRGARSPAHPSGLSGRGS